MREEPHKFNSWLHVMRVHCLSGLIVPVDVSPFKNPLTIYRGLSGPPGPKTPKKSENSLLGPPAPGLWKKSGRSLSGPFRDFLQTLQTFSRLFPDSRGVRGRRPRETFLRLFGGLAPGGPERPL